MKALVLGGTGHVGRALVRRLASRGHEVHFTWCSDGDTAAALPGVGHRADLGEPGEMARLLDTLKLQSFEFECFVHAARLRPGEGAGWGEGERTERALRLWVEASRLGVRALAPAATGKVRNAVLLGAWSPGQSLPLAVPVATAQGALVTLAMALGRALAADGVRVNVLALGLLDGGAAAEVSPEQVESYKQLSALRRIAKADEVAALITWLLEENRIQNGKVIAANGGI